MPKGVEHNKDRYFKRLILCVESLMPKGVEHANVKSFLAIPASVESLMPKGVEHTLTAVVIRPKTPVSNL